MIPLDTPPGTRIHWCSGAYDEPWLDVYSGILERIDDSRVYVQHINTYLACACARVWLTRREALQECINQHEELIKEGQERIANFQKAMAAP